MINVKVGVPDVTCLIYEAKDGGPVEDCTKPDINLCRWSLKALLGDHGVDKIDPLQGLHVAAARDWREAQLLGEEELHQVTSLDPQSTEYGILQHWCLPR